MRRARCPRLRWSGPLHNSPGHPRYLLENAITLLRGATQDIRNYERSFADRRHPQFRRRSVRGTTLDVGSHRRAGAGLIVDEHKGPFEIDEGDASNLLRCLCRGGGLFLIARLFPKFLQDRATRQTEKQKHRSRPETYTRRNCPRCGRPFPRSSPDLSAHLR